MSGLELRFYSLQGFLIASLIGPGVPSILSGPYENTDILLTMLLTRYDTLSDV